MKDRIKLWDRMLLILYAVLGIVVAVALAAALLSGLEIRIFGLALRLKNSVSAVVAVLCAAIVLVAWPVRLLMTALRRPDKGKDESVALQNTENGAVRISVQAMNTLVRQAIGEAEGMENVESTVVNHDDSISVVVDMALRGDVHIPNITTLMQRSIKEFIEEYSGIAVRDVTVVVSKVRPVPIPQMASVIAAEPAKAVEAPKESEAGETAFAEDQAEDGQNPDEAKEQSPAETVRPEENENPQIEEKDIW